MAKIHVVQQGESLPSIAELYGFSDFQKIYEHPMNAELRVRRVDPNILYPNDPVFIPDLSFKEYSRPSEHEYVFRLVAPPVVIRLAVIIDDEPLGNMPYVLEYDDKKKSGWTDSNGKLEEKVPAHVTEAKLKIADYVLDLTVGHLNPSADNCPDKGLSGVQTRLHNLGYGPGEISGVLDDATRMALSSFQFDHELTENGEPDAATKQKLEEIYGC